MEAHRTRAHTSAHTHRTYILYVDAFPEWQSLSLTGTAGSWKRLLFCLLGAVVLLIGLSLEPLVVIARGNDVCPALPGREDLLL